MPVGSPRPAHPAAVYEGLLAEGVFALPRCAACRRAHFPPRTLCPHCGDTDLEWSPATGDGTVYSVSAVQRRDRDPRIIVLVDLADGPRLMSAVLDARPQDVVIGAAVRVEVGTLDDQPLPLCRLVTA